MSANNRRAHPRYSAWFPIELGLREGGPATPAMLCDVSVGGALVWAFCDQQPGDDAVLDIAFRSGKLTLPATVVSVERQWDTAIIHVRWQAGYAEASPGLAALVEELREHFDSYQSYLAHRADDDPTLGRTSTQYPHDRAN